MITQLDMCYLINQWFYNEFAIYFIKKKKKNLLWNTFLLNDFEQYIIKNIWIWS